MLLRFLVMLAIAEMLFAAPIECDVGGRRGIPRGRSGAGTRVHVEVVTEVG